MSTPVKSSRSGSRIVSVTSKQNPPTVLSAVTPTMTSVRPEITHRPSTANVFESRHCFEAEADFWRTQSERRAKHSALDENERLRYNFKIVAVWALAMTALSAYLLLRLTGL